MSLDIDKLIADAKAKREAAAKAQEEAKAAANASKAVSKEATDVQRLANNKFAYAEGLQSTLNDYEGQLKIWATKIARDGKLGPVDQKTFDNLMKQYKSVDAAYNKALKEGNTILAKMPKAASEEIKKGVKTPEQPKVEEEKDPEITITEFKDLLADPAQSDLVKAVQSDLNRLGYKLAVDGKYSIPLQNAIQDIYQVRASLPAALKGTDLRQFIATVDPAIISKAGGGAGGKGGTTKTTSISAPTEIAGKIQSVFQNVLGRDATAAEIKSIGKQLTDAEKNNPTKTVTDSNGNITYSGGIDRTQFLTDIVKALPEFATKKASAGKTIESNIRETALDNNLYATPQQLKTWTDRVQNGEDIKTIQNEIRLSASTGYPEQVKKLMAAGTDLRTILNPYINAMSSTLEVNPNTISLNDPTLHMAVSNPDGKEMTLYQYQTALRKDPRWQYTDNAKSEASDIATKVLKDFGFMG